MPDPRVRRRPFEPHEPEPLAISPENARRWTAIHQYNEKVRAAVAAGAIPADKAQYASQSTSGADLTKLIQNSGVPWQGPMPSEVGLHSGSFPNGLGTNAPRAGNSPAPSAVSASDPNAIINQSLRGASLGIIPTAPRATQPTASATPVAPAPRGPAPLDADQISAVQQAARFSPKTPFTPAAGSQPWNGSLRGAQAPPSVAAMASMEGRAGPALQAQLSQQAQEAVNAAGRRGVPATFGNTYGKVGQEDAPAAPMTVNAGQTAFFNNQPLAPGATVAPVNPLYGRGVGVTEQLPSDAPSYTGGEKGKFIGSDEQARIARVGSPAASLATANSPVPAPKQLDPAAQKDILLAYPEVGNAGSWAHTEFMKQMKPGENTPQQAMTALERLTAAPPASLAAANPAQLPDYLRKPSPLLPAGLPGGSQSIPLRPASEPVRVVGAVGGNIQSADEMKGVAPRTLGGAPLPTKPPGADMLQAQQVALGRAQNAPAIHQVTAPPSGAPVIPAGPSPSNPFARPAVAPKLPDDEEIDPLTGLPRRKLAVNR